MDDHLGVALGVEHVPQRLQLGDQLLVVVDFTVEDHHHGTVFIEQRLLAGGNVDNGQTPVAQSDAGLDVQAAFVRPAVQLRVVHTLQHRTADVAAATGVENSSDSAHVGLRCFRRFD